MNYLQQGTPGFRRASLALFAGGFVTFAVLYSTQPLMPMLSRDFGVSPAAASVSVSAATMALAASLLVAGSLSEAWGRKSVMSASLVLSSLLAALTALSPTYHALLGLRLLQGATLAGLPAIAMAYLGEEVEPYSLGLAMGLYISGNSIGGMSGRIIADLLAAAYSWRVALGALGGMGLLASLGFWATLPPSSHFHPRPLRLGPLFRSLLAHLRDPGLTALYGLGFLLMGSFVTLYNYISYLLVAPPYNVSPATVGWVFLLYLIGAFSSTWMGRVADRLGRAPVLRAGILAMLTGIAVTLAGPLAFKLLGTAALTFGFFGSHSIASSWVAERAPKARAQASALYLFFYYLGSSLIGTSGGFFWSRFGWPGVVVLIALLMGVALMASLWLGSREPVRA